MAEEQGNNGQGREAEEAPQAPEAEGAEEAEKAPAEEPAPAQAAEPAPPRPSRRGGLWLGLLALLIALAAAGFAGYGYWHFQNRLGQVSDRLEVAGQERRSAQEALAQLRDELGGVPGDLQAIREEQKGFADRLGEVDDRLGTLRQATEDLFARIEGGPTYWRLERVESLLLAADRIARLEGDAQAAHAALGEADRMLRNLNDPAWLDVREAIQKAMTRLEQVPNVDVPGIAFRLASLGETALDLPLQGQEAPSLGPQEAEAKEAAPPEGVWGRTKHALGEFWKDVKGLVRLRRSGEEVEPLLPPDEAAFLRHNLVLNLQAARLALLRDRPEVYRQSLASARDWVERFFDTESDEVAGMIGALEDLEGRSLATDLPKLDEPLQVLRQVRKERQD